MSLHKDVDMIKENFWKEPINESAKVVYDNEKVIIYGPMESQAEMDALVNGRSSSRLATGDGGGSKFNNYYLHDAENIYVVEPKQGDGLYIVMVSPQSKGSVKKWWDKNDNPIPEEQVAKIVASLGIPYGDSNESVMKA